MNHHPLVPALIGLAALATACPHAVPDHLRVDPPKEAVGGIDGPTPITDRAGAVAAIVGSDPLVRSPTLPPVRVLRDVADTAPLIAYVESVRQLEGGEGQVPRSMQQLEDDHRGSEAVALARGYRLRVTENLLASPAQAGPERDSKILSLLTPLTSSGEGSTLNRAPLDWLGSDESLESRTRAYAERWTLAGWLDAPKVDIGPAGEALAAPMYDGLLDTPMGSLVASRARGDQGDDATVAAAMDDLRSATRWALQEAAADRDTEQGAWATTKAEATKTLGDDPIDVLLKRAWSGFEPAGGRPEAVGGALLAHAGRRWRGTCDDAPCVGLDRVDTMAAAGRWSDEVAPLAHVWRVLALKDALDTMDVAHDTVMYPRGVIALVDAVLGTGGGPLEDQILRKRSPDEGVWLVLARGVGVEGVTSWDGARAALGAHLQGEARRAATTIDDPEMVSYLDRIARRAIP